MENSPPGPGRLRREFKPDVQNAPRPLVARIVTIERKAQRGEAQVAPAPIELPARAVCLPSVTQNVNEPPDEIESEAAARCDSLIAAAHAHNRRGNTDQAQNSLREAAVLADRIADSARLSRAVLALPGWQMAAPQPPNPLARLFAERALVLEQHDLGTRAMLTARLAAEMFATGDEASALEKDASALDLADLAGDFRAQLYTRCCRDRMLRHADRLAERLSNAEEILRLSIAIGDYAAYHLGALATCESLATSGRLVEAHHMARLADGIATISQVEGGCGSAQVYRSACAIMEGRFAGALESYAASQGFVAGGYPDVLDLCWPMMLVPLDERGQLREIESAAESTLGRRGGVAVYEALVSWIWARNGRLLDASFALQRFAADRFLAVSRSEQSLASMAALADVAVEVKRPDYAEIIYERMAPYASLATTLGSVAIFGSVALHLGRLAVLMGRLDDAGGHFQNAIEVNRRIGARPWAVYSTCEFARLLSVRGLNSDRQRALELAAAAEAEAGILGMPRLASIAGGLLEKLRTGAGSNRIGTAASVAAGPSETVAEASPGTAARYAAAAREPSLTPGTQAEKKPGMLFRNQGEYWLVGSRSHPVSLKHRSGLALICCLLRHPGREIHATELGTKGEVCAQTGSLGVALPASDSHPVLDSTAKESYRARLKELREELEQAREFNDFGRAARIEHEVEFITRELARALGLAGRDRNLGSEAERARKRVSLAIKEAIRVIFRHDPFLGRYLTRSIRTGRLCGYTPDPENPLDWEF